MKLSWLVLLAACDAGSTSPYGNKPHIMGRAGVLNVHDTLADVQKSFPQVGTAGVGQFEDGTTKYRLFYTESGRIDSILVYMPGTLADLEAGWGHGTRGVVGGYPGDYYFDREGGTAYTAFAGESQFVVGAQRYLPLSKIWDDGHDIRVFGLDLLGKPLADDLAALAAIGIDGTTRDHVTRNADHIVSDAGTVQWSLESNDNGRVTKVTVQIGPYDVPSNVPAMDALFVEKWGKPTPDHGKLKFAVEPHTIVEYHDKDVWITE